MLNLIKVKNYAVIDEVEVELDSGLSVLTGETGAGKSILVDALGLALGDRADASAVRPGTERAEIGVLFECSAGHPAVAWLRDRGLDADDGLTCLLRRTISAEGRSRAYINGHPVTRQDLRTLGALLVDIHGQSAHQALLGSATQREIIDHHGDHLDLAREVSDRYEVWTRLRSELADKRRGVQDRASELELLQLQARELTGLDWQDGELEPLEAERGRLANVDRLADSVEGVLEALYEGEEISAHTLIAGAQRALADVQALDPSLTGPAGLLGEAEIHVREAAAELARYRDRLEPDPQRLEWIDARLTRVRALAARHRVGADELGSVLARLTARIEELEDPSGSLEALAADADRARERYLECARRLSAARTASATKLSEAVSGQLADLGLPNGRFVAVVRGRDEAQADAHGLDEIEFLVSLNPGQPLGPLSRVASGGELSRVSLALEVVSAGATGVPTLVFDEVDAGIGGGVAEIVGRRLADIGAQRQVLCVTHLAQVASQGQHHYHVLKSSDGRATRTSVRRLGQDERVEELSRMLGGVEITARTRAHAEEMIERAAH